MKDYLCNEEGRSFKLNKMQNGFAIRYNKQLISPGNKVTEWILHYHIEVEKEKEK